LFNVEPENAQTVEQSKNNSSYLNDFLHALQE
jgi:hypothetical protein